MTPLAPPEIQPFLSMPLSNTFRTVSAPGTGRRAVQLTTGHATCYPLYYFIPSFSADGRRLVYHRSDADEVQLHTLDLVTGESAQITRARGTETRWIPWCSDSPPGVLDHRSALNVARDEVIYFDGGEARSVGIGGGNDRLLFSLPEDRIAIGQNCVSGDGEWFVYIHHGRESFREVYPPDQPLDKAGNRSASKGTVLAAHHLDTGEHRDLVVINSPIHHVLPWGEDQLVFCHPATENGMLLTDLNGGWYAHLRTQDSQGGCVCHYVSTAVGIAYEVLGGKDGVFSGLYDPASHRRHEFRLPGYFGYTHTGRDPEGKLWFYENATPETHDLHFLARHVPGGRDEWMPLTGNWPTFGSQQKSHFHPQVTPDRNWILLVAGDPASRTNHLFLLDISDLKDTEGLRHPLQS